jgi:hypothetical protein
LQRGLDKTILPPSRNLPDGQITLNLWENFVLRAPKLAADGEMMSVRRVPLAADPDVAGQIEWE